MCDAPLFRTIKSTIIKIPRETFVIFIKVPVDGDYLGTRHVASRKFFFGGEDGQE